MKERPFGASNHLILLVQLDLLTKEEGRIDCAAVLNRSSRSSSRVAQKVQGDLF
jgi:hypothetical protein